MSRIKVGVLIIIFICGLLGAIVLKFGFPLWPLIYWWILIFTIFIIWNFKLGSGFILWVSFSVFMLSALFVIIGLRSIGETLMRVSFLGWVIGLIQSMVEYKRN